ncbi:DNA-directed DNA RNA polymerase mu isoform C [Chlorella sorokiniana]|uniref:DNA-directed DNA RNA polymerase mu isoform C n=1 Tax=Chlorella sorokiniana TaxID=3076 RepID=A0A2P6TK14_CHLSO|nr:DNA-directed DNA RNA polymerase mu isoform C [Chlorella sorokiniana]|eukprot:PRW44417.1 DNA-directed DNA RNA polymerase mu isoform C [Chlorella sorokiniana]
MSAPGGGGGAPAAAAAPAAKRQRTMPLAGICLFVPVKALPGGSAVFAAWKRSLPGLGASLTQDGGAAGITHAVVPQAPNGTANWGCLPPALAPPGPSGLLFVTQHWVADSIRRQQRQDEGAYRPAAARAAAPPPKPAARAAPSRAGSMRKGEDGEALPAVEAIKAWLGPLWRPECAEMDLAELALQGDYDEERCRRIGNEHVVEALRELRKFEEVVEALRELRKFEEALNGQWLKNPQGKAVSNHKSLAYMHAASAVRTCAYKLAPPVRPEQLPLVGDFTAGIITEILETGSCAQLEQFRRDEPVRDSRGGVRADSAGAATRRAFTKLPGVGAKVAQQWWDRGLRTYEDVIEAAASRGLGAAGSKPLVLNATQRFALEHRADLLEGTAESDLEEMRAAIAASLISLTGARGWHIEIVGGSRRQQRPAADASGSGGGSSSRVPPKQHHDADFMVTHHSYTWGEDLIGSLRDELIARRRILPPDTGAMCMLQQNRAADIEAKLMDDLTGASGELRSNVASDRLDHIFATFRTAAGRLRRMDVILVTPDQLPYALIGWIGSTMFNRFLRRHMNHGLWRIKGGRIVRVPDQAPPINRRGQGPGAK